MSDMDSNRKNSNEEKNKNTNVNSPEITELKEEKIEVVNTIENEKKDIVKVNEDNKVGFINKMHEKIGVMHTFIMLTIAFIIVLIFLVLLFSFIQFSDKKIKKGVSINGINVSGLTKTEAKNLINEKIINNLENDITFKYNNYTYVVSLDQINAYLDVDSAVDMAYSVGRNGNIFENNFEVIKLMFNKTNINMGVIYDEALVENCFDSISKKLPEQVVQPNYYIDGSELIITSGKPGPCVDIDKAKIFIVDAIKEGNYNNCEYELPIETEYPEEINIEKIKSEVEREPKDAYYTVEPRMVYPHENGIQFQKSVDELKEELKEKKEEYSIGLNIIKPNVTVNDLGQEAFPDMLSTFSTNYAASNYNRTTNLQLASNKINGVVIMPGEVFSYNKTVGERTIEAGYKNAAVFENGQVVDGLGGGICQISSTLYNTVLYADLEIVERYNHTFLTSYLPGGRDATVVYGVLDFQFKNNRDYPIKISSTVSGGVATIQIYGLATPSDCEVIITQNKIKSLPYGTEYVTKAGYASGSVIQGGSPGSIYEAYITKKRNGEVVSSDLLSRDTYSPMNTMIAR